MRKPPIASAAAVAVILAVSLPVLAFVDDEPAQAATNNVQFNMYGRAREGNSWPADSAWLDMSVYAYNTGNWPWAVTFNEMCKGVYGVSGQWEQMVWNLASVGLWGEYGATATYSDANSYSYRCKQFGNAAFGAGDTSWASPIHYQYNSQGPHTRKFVCVNPRISAFGFNHRVCSTHLETDLYEADSSDQLDEVNSFFHSYSTSVPTIWGGDFNLSPQYNGNPPASGHLGLMGPYFYTLLRFIGMYLENHFSAGDNWSATFPNCYLCDPSVYRKLDYSGFSYPAYHDNGGYNINWPGAISCYCSFNGQPISDHALIARFCFDVSDKVPGFKWPTPTRQKFQVTKEIGLAVNPEISVASR